MQVTVNKVVDCKGLTCPMPIIRTKKEINDLEPGEVMEIQATDKESIADLKAWSESTGHEYIGSTQDGEIIKHYIRKVSKEEEKQEQKHEDVISLDELLQYIEGEEKVTVLDVREPAEYAFGHIPGAINIPLGELEKRFEELNKEEPIHVICRTGNRSDLAAQKLAGKGFSHVKNVIPGMNDWKGPTEKTE
ncbi:MAG: sulfurtransferase TusA family protein [Bacillaceae bacterium]|nr:sulfurtransferase TusA family protein [Bacillaceae bacterium]